MQRIQIQTKAVCQALWLRAVRAAWL